MITGSNSTTGDGAELGLSEMLGLFDKLGTELGELLGFSDGTELID